MNKSEKEWMDEKWKPFPGWDGYYEISNYGRARSLLRKGKNRGRWGVRSYGGIILKPITASNGYLAVNLTSNGIRKQEHIHRAVLFAFNGEPPHGYEACHNNGIKTDVRLSNLRWDTKKSNCADKKLHGTWQCGEAVSTAKLTEDRVRIILSSSISAIKLAKQMGVGQSTVLRIRHRESWAHVK